MKKWTGGASTGTRGESPAPNATRGPKVRRRRSRTGFEGVKERKGKEKGQDPEGMYLVVVQANTYDPPVALKLNGLSTSGPRTG